MRCMCSRTEDERGGMMGGGRSSEGVAGRPGRSAGWYSQEHDDQLHDRMVVASSTV